MFIHEKLSERHAQVLVECVQPDHNLSCKLPSLYRLWKVQIKDDTFKTMMNALMPYVLGKKSHIWPTRSAHLIVCIPSAPFVSSVVSNSNILFSHAGLLDTTNRDCWSSFQGTVYKVESKEEHEIRCIGGVKVLHIRSFKGGSVLFLESRLSPIVALPKKENTYKVKVLAHESLSHDKYQIRITVHTRDDTASSRWSRMNEDFGWIYHTKKPCPENARTYVHLYDRSTHTCIASFELDVRYIPPSNSFVSTSLKRKHHQLEDQLDLKQSTISIMSRMSDLNQLLVLNDMSSTELRSTLKSLFSARAQGWTVVHFLACIHGAHCVLASILDKFFSLCEFRSIDEGCCTPLMLAMRYDNAPAVALLFDAQCQLNMNWKAMWNRLLLDVSSPNGV